MERESLLQEYDETIHKQAALLKRQQEKELCQAENKRQALEVQRLRQEVGSMQTVSGEGYQLPVSQLKEYERVIQALEEETQRLRSEISKMEDEKMEMLKQNVGLKKQITSMEFQIEQEEKEIRILKSTDHEKGKSTLEMKECFANLNKQFVDQSEDLRILVLQTRALQKNKDHLSKVLMNVNARLEDARLRVSESVRIAEDALVEKDAALLREKHALNEVSRLESSVSSVMVEAGEKAQAELLKIKDGYNTNIKSISQEVVRLEMTLNEKRLECSKAHKEQDKVSSEIEQTQAELNRRKEQHREEILNLHQRISSQENQIVALQVERDNMSTVNLHSTKENEEQREELLARVQELEHHLALSRSDCQSLKTEYEELKREYLNISRELKKLGEESKSNEKYLKRQLRMKTEELEESTSSSCIRLDAADSSHRGVLMQLNGNIATLQESYSKLQSQMESQKRDYEERITEVTQRFQDNMLKYKNAIHSIHETKTELAVAKNLISQYKNRIEELEERLHAAEQRFSKLQKKSTFTGNSMDIL